MLCGGNRLVRRIQRILIEPHPNPSPGGEGLII
jgi:hypothetical protein